jgi:hypothetical protein
MDMQSNTPSHKEKGMSYRGRLFARLGFILAFVILLCPGAPFAYILFIPSRKSGNFWDDTFPIILTLGIIGGAIFAIIKLRPLWNAPIRVIPSYDSIAPNRFGEIFEVWYQETIQGLPFGNGTIAFQPGEIILEGHLFRGTLYSLLSKAQGEKVSAKVPRSEVVSVSIEERHIIFKVKTTLIMMPNATISFYVSEMDGERMYKELKQHFPSALSNS